ncbi:MAG: acyltransferase family protein [Kiloniellales bacterium]
MSYREPSSRAPIGYRPEIDGLRALAVMPVVLFHADFGGVPGGYLGVDIFFVISGHLIGSIILADLQRDRFSLLNFYERRARRILPALLFVMLVCLPFAWLWLMPGDLTDFAQSVVATTLFGSNALFWYKSGYFDTGAELNPLLHTWSLSVEAQFYVIFPVLLAVVWRYWRPALGALVLIGFATSLALAEHASRHNDVASFYFLQFRAWELLGGALLAYVEHRRGFPSAGRWGALLSLAGLVGIGLSLALFDSETKHPGLYTLLPVASTALVIVFGACDGLAKRILTAKVMVGLGLISYSLYLWHLPLFALANHYALDPLSPFAYALLVAASVAAAALTWRFIEVPFRRRDRISLKAFLPAATVAATGLIAFGLTGHFREGFEARYEPSIQALLAAQESDGNRALIVGDEECIYRSPDEACHLGVRSQQARWALVGDSHAGALGPGFDSILKRIGEGGIQVTRPGCAFALGMRRHDRGLECLSFGEAALDRLLDPEIEHVILMARYALYLTDERYDNGEGGVARGNSPGYGPPGFETEEDRRKALGKSYVQTVKRLLDAGKKVILVYPVPEVGWDVPVRLAKLALRGRYETVSTSYARYRSYASPVFTLFDSLGERSNLVRVYPHEMLCDRQLDDRCIVQDGDRILYSDSHHLSLEGAGLLVERIFAAACARWGCMDPSKRERALDRTAAGAGPIEAQRLQ